MGMEDPPHKNNINISFGEREKNSELLISVYKKVK
jgi:hypothetical protein